MEGLLPILVTDDGMSTDVRASQLRKACSPIDVTDDGMLSDVREEQPPLWKAPL